MTRLVVGSATDVGLVRSNNQDQLLVTPGLYAVADGMGGHAAGEVASLTAIRALDAAFEASDEHTAGSLESAAKAANSAVWEQAMTNRSMLGMGTTLVALAVVDNEDGTSGLAVAHIGDSRVYLYRDGALAQLTVDHSLVQELVDEGQISEAQAAVHPQRHVLTRALGVEPSVDVDVIHVAPKNDDRYLLCSDGLPREASDDEIADVLARFADPSEAARELVALANSRGGSDNVTVVVVDVLANENSPDTLIIVPGPASSSATPGTDTRPVGQLADGADGDGSGPDATPPEGARAERARADGMQGPAATKEVLPKRFTFRVVGFVVALCVVVGGGVACVAWYARSSYFVSLKAGHIAIFRGRPGGVLWFQPTLSDLTTYSASAVLPYNLQSLRSGQLEASLGDAHQYVQNLVAAKREAEMADQPPPRGGPPSTPVTSRSGTTTPATGTRGRRPARTVTTTRPHAGGKTSATSPTTSKAHTVTPTTTPTTRKAPTSTPTTSRPATSRPSTSRPTTSTPPRAGQTVPRKTPASSPPVTTAHTSSTSRAVVTTHTTAVAQTSPAQTSHPGHTSPAGHTSASGHAAPTTAVTSPATTHVATSANTSARRSATTATTGKRPAPHTTARTSAGP